MRQSGVLCPVFSLPSPYGIGSFSKEAYEFVDFLADAGQAIWQILPLGPTSYGDSPYQSVSSFAGNPYFISLDDVSEMGLLKKEDYADLNFGDEKDQIDYGKLYELRFDILRKAYEQFKVALAEKCLVNYHEKELDLKKDYELFVKYNESWLTDYTRYMAIKGSQEQKAWTDWDKELMSAKSKAVDEKAAELEDEIGFFAFQQYLFNLQYMELKEYANEKGVKIMGDIPFYAAADSADIWADPEAFKLDKNFKPTVVAGCPPDAFSEDGQLWGNPVYDWKALKKDHYRWWIRRIKRCFELYDIVRIDHFRGFSEYYEIPADAENAKEGEWVEGPRMDLFKAINKELGNKADIVAEDLGIITDEVRELLKETTYPGMKILHFAISGEKDNAYLPYNCIKNSVIYTGTHDNETTVGWLQNLNEWQINYVRKYANSPYSSYEGLTWDLIRVLMGSVSDTCIIPIQDYLVKGNKARINFPGTFGSNWQWRLLPNEISKELTKSILEITQVYGREMELPEEDETEAAENAEAADAVKDTKAK
ncbi:MAG: 4-alpha-glucanotransferase [Lachnospiraceae bacterium]|nr:4-alpha-glucanotransferase [Candidatus Equihabitans merdae]